MHCPEHKLSQVLEGYSWHIAPVFDCIQVLILSVAETTSPRDTKIKTDEEPDWVIYTEKLLSLSKYDEYRIKQDVGNYLDNK